MLAVDAAVAVTAGVGLHLLRDLATGSGVPLLWPLDVVEMRCAASASVLVVLAVLAGRRGASVRGSRRGSAA